MAKRSNTKKVENSTCEGAASNNATPAREFFERLPDAGEIDDMMAAARQVLDRLPSNDDIRGAKLDCADPELVRIAALAGKAALNAISGAQGNVDPDDAFVAMNLLEQQNMILATAGDTAGPGGQSCVGRCRSERKTCIKEGTNKHRCNFDAFLCRMNCFFTVNVGVNVG